MKKLLCLLAFACALALTASCMPAPPTDRLDIDLRKLSFAKTAQHETAEESPAYICSADDVDYFITQQEPALLSFNKETQTFEKKSLAEGETILYAGFDEVNRQFFTYSASNSNLYTGFSLRIFDMDGQPVCRVEYGSFLVFVPYSGSYFAVLGSSIIQVDSKGAQTELMSVAADSELSLYGIDDESIYLYVYGNGDVSIMTVSRRDGTTSTQPMTLWDTAAYFEDSRAGYTLIGARSSGGQLELAELSKDGSILQSSPYSLPAEIAGHRAQSLISFQSPGLRLVACTLQAQADSTRRLALLSLDESFSAVDFTLPGIEDRLPLCVSLSQNSLYLITYDGQSTVEVWRATIGD